MKGDDGAGPLLVGMLKDKTETPCINAGVSPENYVGKIAGENPQAVLLVDAADMGMSPGKWRILMPEEIAKTGFTTHDLSPGIFMTYLRSRINADIYLLGIQPENVSMGAVMSGRVKKAICDIAERIKEVLNARDASYKANNNGDI